MSILETAIIPFANGYADPAKAQTPTWTNIIMAVLSTGEADVIHLDKERVVKVKRKSFGDVLGIELCVWCGAAPLDFCSFMMPRSAVTYLEFQYPL
ncbi:MAG: hypothetical protein RBJ76_13620 [Stenomitos frigidus ULC029]